MRLAVTGAPNLKKLDRSQALTFSAAGEPKESRNGIRIVPDRVVSSWPEATRLPAIGDRPAAALDEVLHGITARYGAPTMNVVAIQLEYPTQGTAAGADRTREDRSRGLAARTGG
jgi:hypothetical protein